LPGIKKIIPLAELYNLHQSITALSGLEKIEFLKNYFFGPTSAKIQSNKLNFSNISKRIIILIDPGHMACNYREAIFEKKFLCIYPNDPLLNNSDTLKFYEAYYTGLTAEILGDILTQKGFLVKFTRSPEGGSSFGNCFEDFFRNRNKLERKFKDIFKNYPNTKYQNPHDYSRVVFRNADLRQRKKILLQTNPDLLVSIHYNVEVTNKPWNRSVGHNYSMAFIPGGFDSISPTDTAKILNFICLLLDNTLPHSLKLSENWIKNIKEKLNVNPALPYHASYLESDCVYSGIPGIYSRNLALINALPCPVLYGEAFLMDSADEIKKSFNVTDYKGKKIPFRIYQTAWAYAEAILEFFKNK
jgi:N-acetylmuramoyl-L-alanine amidase